VLVANSTHSVPKGVIHFDYMYYSYIFQLLCIVMCGTANWVTHYGMEGVAISRKSRVEYTLIVYIWGPIHAANVTVKNTCI
jgi:protein involved in ribonucleotide reduction